VYSYRTLVTRFDAQGHTVTGMVLMYAGRAAEALEPMVSRQAKRRVYSTVRPIFSRTSCFDSILLQRPHLDPPVPLLMRTSRGCEERERVRVNPKFGGAGL